MGLLSSIANAIKKATGGSSGGSKGSSGGSSSSGSKSNGSSSGYSSSGNYKQDMDNYLANGGKTTDAAYQSMNSARNDKIMSTDWQAKINAAKTDAKRKWLNDVRNEKLAMGGNQNGNNIPSWLSGTTSNTINRQGVGYEEQYGEPNIQKQMDSLAEARTQSAINNLAKARNNALAGLDTQKASLEPYYYDKRNQAAARSDVGAMNFAQYMAGRNVSGSAGAMPEMYRNAGLQSQIGALDQQQAAEMAQIERDRTNINTNYEYDVAAAQKDIEAQRLQDYISQMNADRAYNTQLNATNQSNYVSTIGAYANDYQAEINKLKAQGVSDDDYRIKALQAARNEKINAEKEQMARAQAQQYENDPSYATALQAYKQGIRTDQVLRVLGMV